MTLCPSETVRTAPGTKPGITGMVTQVSHTCDTASCSGRCVLRPCSALRPTISRITGALQVLRACIRCMPFCSRAIRWIRSCARVHTIPYVKGAHASCMADTVRTCAD